MLTRPEYTALCKSVLGTEGKYDKYKDFVHDYDNWFKSAISYLTEEKPERVIILFLESGPDSIANYIFHERTNRLNKKSDSYLWNIYNGFGLSPAETKDDALNGLLRYTSNNKNIPVVIMDLFPFHGIKLFADRRQKICSDLNNAVLHQDVRHYLNQIQREKLFLFGVPQTIWNCAGGFGNGSLYQDNLSKKSGLLGDYVNNNVVMNVGGQNISSKGIVRWRVTEGVK